MEAGNRELKSGERQALRKGAGMVVADVGKLAEALDEMAARVELLQVENASLKAELARARS